jgi:hypothetical protein
MKQNSFLSWALGISILLFGIQSHAQARQVHCTVFETALKQKKQLWDHTFYFNPGDQKSFIKQAFDSTEFPNSDRFTFTFEAKLPEQMPIKMGIFDSDAGVGARVQIHQDVAQITAPHTVVYDNKLDGLSFEGHCEFLNSGSNDQPRQNSRGHYALPDNEGYITK